MSSSETLHKSLCDAREQARAQWNANPCGAVPADAYDSAFFATVERERYADQYWQKDFFDYTAFPNGRVLEIGVGLGTDLKQFARSGAQCFGVDITDSHLALTRTNFELEGLPVELHRADATALPFPDNYFDCVYSFGVIHHIPDVQAVTDEIHRVLKPGGVFQVAVYHLLSIHTLYLFLYGLKRGQLHRLGASGVLATIEKGADGVRIKPYVKLYSRGSLKKLLSASGLRVKELRANHVRFDQPRWLNWFKQFERFVGWYVCAKAVTEKPAPR